MTPPSTFNVLDSHGGFTAVTRLGTLWRPGAVLKRGTVGTLVEGTIDTHDFYQQQEPVTSAEYKLPGYGYRVRVWWTQDGERIA